MFVEKGISVAQVATGARYKKEETFPAEFSIIDACCLLDNSSSSTCKTVFENISLFLFVREEF